jgi:membrane-bound metal-dependent hydrolase YbcI (DUF457 family)
MARSHYWAGAVGFSGAVTMIGGFPWQQVAIGAGVAGVAALGPDIDNNTSTASNTTGLHWASKLLGNHREGAHCILFILTLAAVTHSMAPYVGGNWFPYAMTIGWASHTFLDLFNRQGVAILYPFTKRKFRLGTIKAGERVEKRVVFPTVVVTGGLVLAEIIHPGLIHMLWAMLWAKVTS